MVVTRPTHPDANKRSEADQALLGRRDIRNVKTLRISVTDRCNFRCLYCMPQDEIDWVRRDRLLTFEEITTIAEAALRHGIRAFKLTGGEPLVRRDLPRLIALLKALSADVEVSMTTNGSLLNQHAAALKRSGLDRLTVSLDTLDKDKFREITQGADIDRVWHGIQAAGSAGFSHPKINCVAMRSINDDELADFAALTLETDLTVRFIEYMPLGQTILGGSYQDRYISEQDIRDKITQRFGPMAPTAKDVGHGPATVWRLENAAGRIGFISAMSRPFCGKCNRLRLTAEGRLRSCLFDGGEVELHPIVRATVNTCVDDASRAHSALHDAFIRCAAYKPSVHAPNGNRQMSQLGG